MTEENYEYRTSQLMLRNSFRGDGKWEIPIIPKFQIHDGDFDDLLLLGFDRAKTDDEKHRDRMVHFFLYDYKFERVWTQPDLDVEKLSRYRAVLSPDFSMYLEMNPTMQLYNTFRNRCCGAYWASKGIRVIPTVNWGDESTFDFCFRGVEKGSAVAVSTYMASEHNNHSDQKEWFMAGYNEMLRRIEPEKIICYNTPFPEMEGDIVFVDYELSSWKYMNYERGYEKEDLECYKIGGAKLSDCDIMEPYRIGKGGGSAFGGEYKPAKAEDERFVGEPGEIKTTYKRNGTKFETKIGPNGKATMERHHTAHSPNGIHSNPHDHMINWESPRMGFPNLGPPINYWDGDIPAIDTMKGWKIMRSVVRENTTEENRFESISDFKWCMKCGGEVVFIWNGTTYCCFGKVTPPGKSDVMMYISKADSEVGHEYSEKWCANADEVLEYMVSEDRLRDVITQVTVIERTI